MQSVGRLISTAWYWTARAFVVLLGLVLLYGCVMTVREGQPWGVIIIGPAGLWLIASAVLTEQQRATVGKALDAGFERGLSGFGFFLKIMVWIAIAAAVMLVSWLIFRGLAALPVSVAVIIGAVIIANALRSRE